jgi:hypothetical protein
MDQYLAEFASDVATARSLLRAQRISDTGQTLEIALSAFLSRLLPTHVGLGRGHIANADWSRASEEVDIILYDRRYASGFPYLGDPAAPGRHVGLYSADAVIGCIAVTKTLRKAKLKSSFSNLASASLLAPANLSNQMHFDLAVEGAMTFRNGVVVNPLFTAVVAFEDDIFMVSKAGLRKPCDTDELSRKLSALADEKWFCGSRVDLIYTVDGLIMYPMIPTTSGFEHPKPNQWIGKPKGCISVASTPDGISSSGANQGDPPVLLAEDHRAMPHMALRLFLIHTMQAVSWIVKQTPDFIPLVGHPTSRANAFAAPIAGRTAAEKALNKAPAKKAAAKKAAPKKAAAGKDPA